MARRSRFGEYIFNLELDIFNKEVERDILSLAVGACMELSDAQAAEASGDQEEDKDRMDIQADHQVALIVRSEAASPSLAGFLQEEADHHHHHLTEDLQQQHKPRQADHLQESREIRAWRQHWPS